MGIDRTFAKAYAKAAIAAGQKLPSTGNIFITMVDKHKQDVIPIAKKLVVRCCLLSLPFGPQNLNLPVVALHWTVRTPSERSLV